MAAPVRVFNTVWEVKFTDAMASQIKLAAASEGASRRAWIRQAVQERLDRDGRRRAA